MRQCSDALAYWVLPLICFLLPVRVANTVAKFVARRNWFFRAHAARALENAGAVLSIPDAKAWQAEFRLVRFLDAIDVWHGRFSSDRRVRKALVHEPAQWPANSPIVMLGTHLGPGTLLLRCLSMAGFTPRFVYREIPVEVRRAAPVYYGYLVWRMAYLNKVCRGQAIKVPGGRGAVKQALVDENSALILLFDAPSGNGRSATLDVLGHHLPVAIQGLEMACEQHSMAARFGMFWDDVQGKRVIEVEPPESLQSLVTVLNQSESQLEGLLRRYPAQWQLWLTANPVLNHPATSAQEGQ